MSHQNTPRDANQISPLCHLARELTSQVDRLRTMYLHPGETEPVDCTGTDLCGRVREMAHLCQQLNDELEQIGQKTEKGSV